MTRSSAALLLFALACGDDGVPPAGELDSGVRQDAASADSAVDARTVDANAADAVGNGGDASDGDDAGPSDAGAGMDAATSGMCPPPAPYGVEVGDIAPDATLEDCDGNSVSLHSFCGESAAWLYRFSEWCPPCQRFVRNDAEDFYQRFVDEDVKAVLIIAQNSSGEIATRSDCARLSEQFGVSFPVLIDPRSEMDGLGIRVNAEAMAFDSDMRILYSEQYDHDGIPAAVSSALE